MKLSANLGFLWSELSLPEAIHAAKKAGFDAVECHWPYDTPAEAVAQALADTGLSMLGLNTRRGDVAVGENGLQSNMSCRVEDPILPAHPAAAPLACCGSVPLEGDGRGP